jgi:hypothetical protein
MTRRVRGYLLIDAARHFGFGVSMLLFRDSFNPRSFNLLFDIFPRWVWIWSLMLVAAYLTYAAVIGSEPHARRALALGISVSVMWAAAFFLITGSGMQSLSTPILLAALAGKDIAVCSGPLRYASTTGQETR